MIGRILITPSVVVELDFGGGAGGADELALGDGKGELLPSLGTNTPLPGFTPKLAFSQVSPLHFWYSVIGPLPPHICVSSPAQGILQLPGTPGTGAPTSGMELPQ